MKIKALLIILIIFLSLPLWSQHEVDVLNKIIKVDKQKNTVYELLNYIGDASGLYFIYDSKIIDNEKKSKINDGTYTIKQAVYSILQSDNYDLKMIGKYILINKHTSQVKSYNQTVKKTDSIAYKQIAGTVLEKMSKTPIPYCSVSLEGTGIGTVTNNNGKFVLRVPDTLHIDKLHISHIGYEPHRIPIAFMEDNPINIYLTPHIVPIQEVIVRLVNPQK